MSVDSTGGSYGQKVCDSFVGQDGHTPLTIEEIQAGQHKVRFNYEGVTVDRNVVVRANKTTKIVENLRDRINEERARNTFVGINIRGDGKSGLEYIEILVDGVVKLQRSYGFRTDQSTRHDYQYSFRVSHGTHAIEIRHVPVQYAWLGRRGEEPRLTIGGKLQNDNAKGDGHFRDNRTILLATQGTGMREPLSRRGLVSATHNRHRCVLRIIIDAPN